MGQKQTDSGLLNSINVKLAILKELEWSALWFMISTSIFNGHFSYNFKNKMISEYLLKGIDNIFSKSLAQPHSKPLSREMIKANLHSVVKQTPKL